MTAPCRNKAPRCRRCPQAPSSPSATKLAAFCLYAASFVALDEMVERARGLGADVAFAEDDPGGRRQLGQAHRSTRVQLLCRDADLGTEPELLAVGEPRGRIDHHRGRVASGDEGLRG